jgi:hypothetical protein
MQIHTKLMLYAQESARLEYLQGTTFRLFSCIVKLLVAYVPSLIHLNSYEAIGPITTQKLIFEKRGKNGKKKPLQHYKPTKLSLTTSEN